MSLEGAVEELKKLLQTLNEAKEFKYSGEITTNAKGEMQIKAKVRSNDFQQEKTELDGLTGEIIKIGEKHHLRLPESKT